MGQHHQERLRHVLGRRFIPPFSQHEIRTPPPFHLFPHQRPPVPSSSQARALRLSSAWCSRSPARCARPAAPSSTPPLAPPSHSPPHCKPCSSFPYQATARRCLPSLAFCLRPASLLRLTLCMRGRLKLPCAAACQWTPTCRCCSLHSTCARKTHSCT